MAFFRVMTFNYGLWTQIRVDKGTEWRLMLFVQSIVAQHRRDTRKPPYLQTSSRQVFAYLASAIPFHQLTFYFHCYIRTTL